MDPSSPCFKAARGLACRCPLCTGESEMLLQLPNVRQETDWSCGEAAVRTVLQYLGKRYQVPALSTREHGTHPAQIQQALILAGLRTFSGAFRTSQLRACADDWTPVVCAIRDDDGNGHWVVSAGVRRGRVHYQCPLTGPRSLPEAEWVARWHDVGMYGDKFEDFGIAAWA